MMLDAAGQRPIGQKEERGVGVRGAEDERMVSEQVQKVESKSDEWL